MPDYYIWEDATGLIVNQVGCSADRISKYIGPGLSHREGIADTGTEKIDISDPKSPKIPQTEMPATIDKTAMVNDGIDSITISNLSIPSLVKVEKAGTYKVENGTFTFKIDFPGTYKITCSSRLDLDKTFTVTVTDPE